DLRAFDASWAARSSAVLLWDDSSSFLFVFSCRHIDCNTVSHKIANTSAANCYKCEKWAQVVLLQMWPQVQNSGGWVHAGGHMSLHPCSGVPNLQCHLFSPVHV